MDIQKILGKLEHDLSHFLISELCKADPAKRGSPEMYKYKGLNISFDPKKTTQEKTIAVRIGVLEAEFKIDSTDKNSGSLAPEEERLIMLWMQRSENSYYLKQLYAKSSNKRQIPIVPFDLENLFEQS